MIIVITFAHAALSADGSIREVRKQGRQAVVALRIAGEFPMGSLVHFSRNGKSIGSGRVDLAYHTNVIVHVTSGEARAGDQVSRRPSSPQAKEQPPAEFELAKLSAGNPCSKAEKNCGSLLFAGCDRDDIMIGFVTEGKTRGETIMCRDDLSLDDLPAGLYTTVFSDDEGSRIEKKIPVRAMHQTRVKTVRVPSPGYGLLEEADAAVLQNETDKAIALYEQFTAKFPRSKRAAYAFYRRGTALLRVKQFPSARVAFETALARKPDGDLRPEIYLAMAFSYRLTGDAEKAATIFHMLTEKYATSSAAEQAKRCLGGTCEY